MILTKTTPRAVPWSQRLRVRVGQSVIHNSSTWSNITGENTEPSTASSDWENTKELFLTGDEFYIDNSGLLRSNISTYRQMINYSSGTQVFTLDFEPTFFLGIFVNGQYVDEADYIYTTPNQLEVLGTLESGDRVKFVYKHFINIPV